MLRLALIVHLFVGSTLAGSAMIVALVAGWDTLQPLVIAAFVGWLLSIPTSWVLARKIESL
ncbi:CTP synthetase [Rhodobacteraceae bacterium LMO-12]|nr:CTP synthetase [Rhodobacteraceae bacterium LMO-JJ12]